MKALSRLIAPDRITWLDHKTKGDCLHAIVDCLCKSADLEHPDDIYHAILEREKLLSTGFGLGLAIPHAKLSGTCS